MTISRNQMKLIYVAKTKTGLDEETYRSALVQIGGVASIKNLDKDGFEALMGYFEYLGFASWSAKGANYGDRPGMASFAQIEFIRTLWQEYTKERSGEDELKMAGTDLEDFQPAVFAGADRAQGHHRPEGDESPRGLSLFRYQPGQGGADTCAALFVETISGPLRVLLPL